MNPYKSCNRTNFLVFFFIYNMCQRVHDMYQRSTPREGGNIPRCFLNYFSFLIPRNNSKKSRFCCLLKYLQFNLETGWIITEFSSRPNEISCLSLLNLHSGFRLVGGGWDSVLTAWDASVRLLSFVSFWMYSLFPLKIKLRYLVHLQWTKNKCCI